jgi:hypothetical protein
VVRLTFAEEQGASFTVTGAGWSSASATFFAIADAAPQELRFDFDGTIHGRLDLTELAGPAPRGTLVVDRGRVDRGFGEVRLDGVLELTGRPSREVTLRGGRSPGDLPVWPGRRGAGSA